MDSSLSRWLTLPALFAFGAGLGWLVQPDLADDLGRSEKPRISHRVLTEQPSGEEIVDAILTAKRADPIDAAGFDPQKRFEELLEELIPTSDPKATFLELAAKYHGVVDHDEVMRSEELREQLAILGVRYAHWFEQDPVAALTYAKEAEHGLATMVPNHYLHAIAKSSYEMRGLSGSLKWLPSAGFVSWSLLAHDVGKSGSLDGLDLLLHDCPEIFKEGFGPWGMREIAGAWPMETKDSFLSKLSGPMRVSSMEAFVGRMEGREGIEWVKKWMDSGELSEQERRMLAESDTLRSRIIEESSSIEEQLQMLQRVGAAPEVVDGSFRSGLVSNAIQRFLGSSDGWMHRFRNGELTGEELRQAALQACPDAGSETQELIGHLYRHAAEDDPARAEEILAGWSEEDRLLQRAYAAHWWFNGVEPDRSYNYLANLPLDDPETAAHVRDGWHSRSASNLQRYGEDYADWVLSLPEGDNRTWAMEGLLEASAKDNPGIHAMMEAELAKSR